MFYWTIEFKYRIVLERFCSLVCFAMKTHNILLNDIPMTFRWAIMSGGDNHLYLLSPLSCHWYFTDYIYTKAALTYFILAVNFNLSNIW